MKLHSKYFDRIRVKPEEDRSLRNEVPVCEVPGCNKPGEHRAPKGRDSDGEYHLFCLDHVREYNKSYNYFKGMGDNDISDYRERDHVGHRPTWKLGQNSWATMNGGRFRRSGKSADADGVHDPFGFTGAGSKEQQSQAARRRSVRNAERKALDSLGLDETATPDTIKQQYKTLVKRHHPDANGGSRDSEDRLREIIQAYDYLRSVGLCT